MHRRYADISHFRAPFKNWPSLSGFGAAATPATPADQASAAALVAATIDTESDGVRVFKPAIAKAILDGMGAWSIVHIDNDNVKLEPALPNDVRETAASWIKRHGGMSIVAGTTGGAQLFTSALPVERYLSAVKGHDGELAATGGATPLGAVLVRGGLFAGLFGKLGPVGVAAVALLGVGAVVVVAKHHKRRRAVANRRRRHHRRGRR
jgi:hypothetical protein